MSSEDGQSGIGKDPKIVYKQLKKDYHYKKNPHYAKIHSRHSRAHNEVMGTVMKGKDTTGLSYDEIIDQMADVIIKYEEALKRRSGKIDDVEKEIVRGKAHQFLEIVAQNEKMDFEDYISKLQKEGIEGAVHGYMINQKLGDVKGVQKVALNRALVPLEYNQRKGLADILRESDEALADTDANVIASNLGQYLEPHLDRIYKLSAPKERGKKKARRAQAA